MANAIDGLKVKIRFTLIQIEKAKTREIAAKRRTNDAIQRTKIATKRAFYLQNKFSALKDKLFINGLILERKFRRLTWMRSLYTRNNEKTTFVGERQMINEDSWEEMITNLEVMELEYNSDAAVLQAKKEVIAKRLDETEERLSIANEEKRILENRLIRANETLRLKHMKRDLDEDKRKSRLDVIVQLEENLQVIKSRHKCAVERIEQLTTFLQTITENLNFKRNSTKKIKNHLREVMLQK